MKRVFLSLLILAVGGVDSRATDRISSSNNLAVQLQFQIDTALAQNQRLYQIQLEQKKEIAELKKLVAGLQGKAGPPGPPGENGKDGEVDYPKVWAWIEEHKAELIPPPPTIEELIAALPPITFERLDETGSVLDSIKVYLGKKAKFPPLTVNYLNDSGEVSDTEYVPIGGTLNLHIDVLEK